MTDALNPTRQDTWRVEVFVNSPADGHEIPYGVWDKCTGGGVDSDSAQYYPGGMVDPISLGGKKTTENVVVTRNYRIGRDHSVVQQLLSSAGQSGMRVTKTPMTKEGAIIPGTKPIVYRGTLKRCTPPETDSTGTDAGMIELEMVVEGFPTAA